MKCMVTGNHGYIGNILTYKLLKAGHDVVGYDCDYFPRDCFANEEVFNSSKKIKQIKKDIRDVTKADMEGIGVVFHLAALPNDPASDLRPKVSEEINAVGAQRLAAAAKAAGVSKFIHTSTCSVFGSQGDEKIDENTPPSPITTYGKSKLRGELGVLATHTDKFTVVALRNATCYGVSPRMRFDMVLNNMSAYAYIDKRVRILSDGSAWRPIVHIEDVADANILAMDAPTDVVNGQVFVVGSQTMRISTLADEVKKALPDSEIEYAENAKKDPRSYNVDSSKIVKLLKFKPKWDAKRGAKEVYDACKAANLNNESFKDKKFWAGSQFDYLIKHGLVNSDLRFQAQPK